MHTLRHDEGMSGIRTRALRPNNSPTVLLQARVAPEARAAVQDAAERSGVSIAYYMEALICRLVEENRGLPVIQSRRPQREELPIRIA